MNELTKNHFIDDIIQQDLASGKHSTIATRFPPEPNGYLHIGHAKAICLNFRTAQRYGGTCNLRFDDTNPSKEETEYVESIMTDIKWLGFEWDNLLYASDYFEKFYEYAVRLIKKGKAFVCDLTAEQIRETRGTLTTPGTPSSYRDRSVEENLDLFERMRAGEFADGEKVLRAKIDMASPNINMRDPVIYRILRSHHHRTGDAWCIYPMYDYAHPLEDAIENITHSLCTLEFEDHRPLYDWCVNEVGFDVPPRQIEFARLSITGTIMSKRFLKKLVDDGVVSGWDDPRMPTLSGMRRRGIPPAAIRTFCDEIGISKTNSVVDHRMLEHFVREELGPKAPRVMAVLNPVKVVIKNYPEGQTETLTLENNPDDETAGIREVTFSREVYIEAEDFMEEPPNKFFRLAPGREVRLKGAYIIKCEDVVKDADGNITEIVCTYDPDTKSGADVSGRKVKGTLHWVDCATAVPITARLYENLLTDDDKAELSERLSPDSLKELANCFAEPVLRNSKPGDCFQFMRMGYFCRDLDDGLIFNRVVGLRDSWAKINKK